MQLIEGAIKVCGFARIRTAPWLSLWESCRRRRLRGFWQSRYTLSVFASLSHLSQRERQVGRKERKFLAHIHQISRERSKKTEGVFLVGSRESEGKSKSPPGSFSFCHFFFWRSKRKSETAPANLQEMISLAATSKFLFPSFILYPTSFPCYNWHANHNWLEKRFKCLHISSGCGRIRKSSVHYFAGNWKWFHRLYAKIGTSAIHTASGHTQSQFEHHIRRGKL